MRGGRAAVRFARASVVQEQQKNTDSRSCVTCILFIQAAAETLQTELHLQQFPTDISAHRILPLAPLPELMMRATAARVLLGIRKHQRKSTAWKAAETMIPIDLITKTVITVMNIKPNTAG